MTLCLPTSIRVIDYIVCFFFRFSFLLTDILFLFAVSPPFLWRTMLDHHFKYNPDRENWMEFIPQPSCKCGLACIYLKRIIHENKKMFEKEDLFEWAPLMTWQTKLYAMERFVIETLKTPMDEKVSLLALAARPRPICYTHKHTGTRAGGTPPTSQLRAGDQARVHARKL